MNGTTVKKVVTLTNGVSNGHHPQNPTRISSPTPQLQDHNNIRPTLGRHVARRLVEVGVSDVFSVPGDFNLGILDHMLAEPGLSLVGCCNELNAGYAADGYARARGVAACAVTFTVGSLSVINAVAGAFSEDLPVICIVGGPNSNDYGGNRVIHHTIGLPDFSQELRCFQTVTCHQAVVTNLENAQEQIDEAISAALRESKPVYISISCNLPSVPHPSFDLPYPFPFLVSPRLSNEMALAQAVEAAANLLNKAGKSVMVAGPKLRPAKSAGAFLELADASGYAVAVMPSAKGLMSESHRRFIGTYWGTVSASSCAETVESADAYLFAGPVFNDLTTVGFSLLLRRERMIVAQPRGVTIGNGPTFCCVEMKDFLKALAKRIRFNETAYEGYKMIYEAEGSLHSKCSNPNEALRVNVLFKHVQNMLSTETCLVAEVGVPWFSCQRLKLPQGCGFEIQIQYGSIGWSLGASLGYGKAEPNKRLICCIGDGSFQMTAQEVSTMIRCGQNNIILLINNGGYSIEVAIHDGPYNVIKNWNYTALVDAIHNGQGKCWTAKVTCEEELVEAIGKAMGEKEDCLCFIEVFVHKYDTNKDLLEFCSRVSSAGARAPKLVS